MAAVGATPIQLYRTTTGAAAPSAGNLAAGELAINYADTDMALFAKNVSGAVKILINNPAGLKYPTADGTAGQFITTDAAGNLSFATGTASVGYSARTSNTILAAGDKGKLIDVTSGTFSQTFTAAATLGAGWWCWLRNSGTGDVTLDPNASELIDGLTTYVMYTGEARLVTCDGSAFTTVVVASFYRAFTSTGTFVMPPGYANILADVISAGAGGARSDSADTGKGAGGGGGGGRSGVIPVSGIAAGTSVTCTVGAGGAGASTNAGLGSNGGTSSFGSYISVAGGLAPAALNSGGNGGSLGYQHSPASNISATGWQGAIGPANAVGLDAELGGGSGAGSSTSTGRAGGGSIKGAPGGGSGSGSGGNAGGAGGSSTAATGGGGAGGVGTGGVTGNAGTAGSAGANGNCGTGGGGGSDGTVTGGAGGAGGAPGGGGGGSGYGATTTGNGGAGARGEIHIYGAT